MQILKCLSLWENCYLILSDFSIATEKWSETFNFSLELGSSACFFRYETIEFIQWVLRNWLKCLKSYFSIFFKSCVTEFRFYMRNLLFFQHLYCVKRNKAEEFIWEYQNYQSTQTFGNYHSFDVFNSILYYMQL